MARLTEDLNGGGNFGRDLAIGEQRTWHAKDKAGNIVKTFTLTRTARAYVYDLCDAYNDARSSSAGGAWYVVGDELRFGDPRWRNDEQWRECVRRNEEWLWEKRHPAQGMSAFGRDPQGHEAKPASPVLAQQECAQPFENTP